ncbi:MAG: ribonuclease PH [Ardenticatenaceae bacterium]|nr:ribonuclease PH [Ardenticatenaceae bacterium]HBY95593.1 ribonuclease PH [Chloroflexota bacterium]
MPRADGRGPAELRPVKMTVGVQAFAEGSVLIEMGRTQVLCAATVEPAVPRWLAGRGSGWVTAEYAMLPRATPDRIRRETSGLGGRTQEIRRLIGRSLRAAVDLDALGERQITIDCDVIQADGGTRTASVTGGFVALALAVEGLRRKRLVEGRVLPTAVAAVSVGIVGRDLLLDLDYSEDSQAEVDMNVVMTAGGHFVELQGTAEGAPFSRTTLDRLLTLSERGLQGLLAAQRTVLEGAGVAWQG